MVLLKPRWLWKLLKEKRLSRSFPVNLEYMQIKMVNGVRNLLRNCRTYFPIAVRIRIEIKMI